MPIGEDNSTYEYRLTVENMEEDLDIMIQEDELNKKGSPLIDWVKPVEWLLSNAKVYEKWEENEQDEEDEDNDFIDLYESGNEDGNCSDDSDDEVYGEVDIGKNNEKMEGNQDHYEEGEQNEDYDVHMIDKEEPSGSGLGAGCKIYVILVLHHPPVVTPAMQYKNVSMLALKRLESNWLGGL